MQTTQSSKTASAKIGSSGGGSGSTSVSTKQVHPAILSTFAPTGCELSTWAYLTLPRPTDSNLKSSSANSQELPNLVTAHSNSLKIHVVDPMSGTLVLASSYDNLAGTITTLHALPNAAGTASGRKYDGLLIGFAGQPRMSIVYPPGGLLDELSVSSSGSGRGGGWSGVLTASSIIDLTPALIERSLGSVSPLEQDLTCCITQDKKVPTVAVILGGGVSIAAFHLHKSKYDGTMSQDPSFNREKSIQNWWRTASDPYFLPLSKLALAVPMSRVTASSAFYQKYQSRSSHTAAGQNVSKFSHGFGDVLSSAFLSGYTEPVLVILHSNPHRYGGRSCTGRLGHRSSYTRTPLCLTAISISIVQRRSVVLWSLPDAMPSDAFECHSHPKGGVLVVGVNEVVYVDCSGKIKCCTAVNGWVRSTGSAALLPKLGSFGGIMQPNPSPLPKLSIQLDGCRLSFVNDNVAMLALRDGTLYTMELHDENECVGVGGDDAMCISLSPVGKRIGGLGMISTLSVLLLLKIQEIEVDFGKFLDESSLNPKKEEVVKDNSDSLGLSSVKQTKSVWKDDASSSLGLIFAGSRMGDSSLLLYGLKDKVELIPLERESDDEERSIHDPKRKREDDTPSNGQVKKEKLELDSLGPNNIESKEQKIGNDTTTVTDDEGNSSLEDMLRLEEEALYGLDSDEGMYASREQKRNITLLPGITPKQLYRPQIRAMSVFQHTKVLDSLTGLGPIGPGCTGPTAGRESKDAVSMFRHMLRTPSKGSVVNVHPCGYGSSGGLVKLSNSGMHPGLTIESEIDCLDVGAIFPCPLLGYFFVQKKGQNSGCIIMRVSKEENLTALEEISIDSVVDDSANDENSIPSFHNVRDVLTRMSILSVKEFQCRDDLSTRCIFITRFGSAYGLIILSFTQGKFVIDHSHFIGSLDDGQMIDRECLVSASFVESLNASKLLADAEDLYLACVWSSGNASIFNISKQGAWTIQEFIISRDVVKRQEDINKSGFYDDGRITAIDVFAIPDNIFETNSQTKATSGDDEKDDSANCSSEEFNFDEDDWELYVDGDENFSNEYSNRKQEMKPEKRMEASEMAPSRYNSLAGYVSGAGLSKRNKSVLAITRQSGQLDIYDVSKVFSLSETNVRILSYEELKSRALLWNSSSGCGQGSSILNPSSIYSRHPLTQESYPAEIRFFFCGPSESVKPDDMRDLSLMRSLCLLVETNQGDTQLYTATKSSGSDDISFERVPLHLVSRPGRDEKRHRDKLIRKGIAKVADGSNAMYRNNRLHRFFSISGEDGLFAATSRPMWFLSERGAPSIVYHRLRHCAPAGGADVPIAGFCSGFPLNSQKSHSGFITVHERIGRVGSQRLTLCNGLSDVFTTHGILTGKGTCVEKIPLGVTVRRIEYIDDPSISNVAHPIFAMLVSREVDVVQSNLINDGLTEQQRNQLKEEKERQKMAKQVEADLGGFDIEHEWVEQIERDDCFEIEKRYGGAPSIPQSRYELWVIDSSNWEILDTFQFDEFEHGMTMKSLSLSDIPPDMTGSSNNADDDMFHDEVPFLAVGTGVIDEDGEDVSSRGRIILFQLRRTGDRTAKFELELHFLYDKEISLGPVTALNGLTCEGKSRLIVGAGAEITLEQWGSDKLTQVGFFHCYMQIQDVIVFKNFILLSDAYDSLHFLVYRESDKSLTLLAKDYEPTSMYATGLLSRGGSLSFVCHDDRQNLTFLSYAPREIAARGGNKLVSRADCHLGTQTTALNSHFCRSSLIINSATIDSSLVALKQQDPLHGKTDDDQRFGLHYGTVDGGFGSITPMNEGTYWRLAALQSVMSNALESDCSLSHRAWRLYRRSTRRGGCKSNDRKKGVIDGDLVMKYVDLSIPEQEDLASAIGSTVDLILDNLLDLSFSSSCC